MPVDPTDRQDNETEDTGEPIAELATLDSDASEGFLDRVRRRIERRQAGSHVLALSWHGMAAVFLEFFGFFFQIFGHGGPDDGGSA